MLINIVKTTSIIKLSVCFIVLILGFILAEVLNDSVLEKMNGKRGKTHVNNGVLNINPDIKYKLMLSHSVREIKIVYRRKINILFFAIMYFLIFLLLSMIDDKNGIFFVSCFSVTIICISSDSIFREDIYNKQIYKVCGETYKRFVLKKLTSITLMINLICIYSIIKMEIVNFIYICLFVLYCFINLIYWTLFYSAIYTKMKKVPEVIETFKVILAIIGMFIPIVNICIVFLYIKIASCIIQSVESK